MKNNRKEKLSVIIVDYHSISKTLNYIINLHQFIEKDFKLHYVVVENYEQPLCGSELDLFEQNWVSQKSNIKGCKKIYTNNYWNARIDILWCGINHGFAIANNIGTVYSKMHFQPAWILYSNNDISFCPGFHLKGMVDILKEKDNVAAVGPCVIDKNGQRQGPTQKVGYLHGLLMHNFIPGKFKRKSELIANPQSGYVYWVSGCFMIVNADKIYQAGLFDTHTFLYCEEMILAERFLSHGWSFYYDNRIQIIHEGGTTISKYADNSKQLKLKFSSRLYYYKRYLKINLLQQILAMSVFHIGLFLYNWKHTAFKRNLRSKNR